MDKRNKLAVIGFNEQEQDTILEAFETAKKHGLTGPIDPLIELAELYGTNVGILIAALDLAMAGIGSNEEREAYLKERTEAELQATKKAFFHKGAITYETN